MGRIAKRALSGFLWLSGGHLAASFIGFLGGVVIARILGPSNYGILSISQYFPMVVFSFLELGLTNAIVRYIAMGRREGYLAFILRIISGLVASIIVFIFSKEFAYILNRPYMATYIKILSLYICGLAVFDATKAALLAKGKYSYVSLGDPLRQILRISISIILILLGFNVYGAIIGFSISSIITSIVLLLLFLKFFNINLSKSFNSAKYLFNRRYIIEVISYSLPLYIPSLLSAPLYRVIEIYIARFISNREMGGYNVAANLSNVLVILSGALNAAIFSTLSNIVDKRDKLNESIEKATIYTSLLIVPIALTIVGASRPIISLIYGSKYVFAHTYLSLMNMRWIYTTVGFITIPIYFRVVGDTKPIMVSGFIHAMVHVGLSVVLVRSLGLVGMLIAYLAADGASTLYLLFIALRQHRLTLGFGKLAAIALLSLLLATSIYLADRALAYLPLYPLLSLAVAFSLLVIFYIIVLRFILEQGEILELEETVISIVPRQIRPLIKRTIDIAAGKRP